MEGAVHGGYSESAQAFYLNGLQFEELLPSTVKRGALL